MLDHLELCVAVALDLGIEVSVVVGAEFSDDAVDHRGAEHAVLLVDGALTLQAVGRLGAALGQGVEAGELGGVLGLVDVNVHVFVIGNLERILDLEAVTAGDAQAGHQLVDVGRPVGRAHLDGLFARDVEVQRAVGRVDDG